MSNLDDFDAPDHFEPEEHEDDGRKAPKGEGLRKNLASAWQASPVFKIFLLLVGGGAIASAALGVFSSDKPKDVKSVVHGNSEVTSTPGGEAPPAFQDAVNQASQQRVNSAVQQGGSAMPTPMGNTTQMTQLDPGTQQSNDPLAEFRSQRAQGNNIAPPPAPKIETQTTTQVQVPQQPGVQQEAPVDQGLATAMQQQMTQLVNSWQPATSKMVTITSKDAGGQNGANGTNASGGTAAAAAGFDRGKALVPAGTINYGQMAIEANSDVPGPIMAQVLSGPFSGGRAVGAFQSTDEYLIIKFTLINFKGKDYPVNAVALNPDTTLGALATETDQRYWTRVILPAAAGFVSGFAQAFSQGDTSVAVSDGVVIQTRTGNSIRRGFGEGTQDAGQQVSSIINQQASKVRPLVRVATGTPIGLFFVSSVFENDPDLAKQQQQQRSQQNGLLGAGLNGINGINGIGGIGTDGTTNLIGYGQNGYNAGNNAGYGQQGYGNTGYNSGYNTGNAYGTLNNGSTSTNYGSYNGNGVIMPANGGTGSPTIINTR